MENSVPKATVSSIPVDQKESAGDWEPHILGFACHFCAYSAADLAGVMRLSYSQNVRVIRLPCSGKLDHSHVLRAFERGIDGVFVAG